MSIRNMMLNLGKNYEMFKKHRQFQIITLAELLLQKNFDQQTLHGPQNLNTIFLES